MTAASHPSEHGSLIDATLIELAARHLIDAAPDATVIVDEAGVIVVGNPGAFALFGYARDELLGLSVEQLIPVAKRKRHQRDRAAYQADPHVRPMGAGLDLIARRANGTELPVEVSLSPLNVNGRRLTIASVRDISARVALEAERRRSADELQHTHDRLVLAEERERIARDLHDTVIQRIFAVGLRLQTAASMAPEPVRDRIVDVVDDLDVTIRELRTAVFQLGAPPQRQQGVRSQILAVAAESARVLGFEPHVRFEGLIEDRISPAVLDHLLSTLREALTNVARHAEAHRVEVDVSTVTDLALCIHDDGRGLAPERMAGNGLNNMKQRAEALGGSCTIASSAGAGTTVMWQVPL